MRSLITTILPIIITVGNSFNTGHKATFQCQKRITHTQIPTQGLEGFIQGSGNNLQEQHTQTYIQIKLLLLCHISSGISFSRNNCSITTKSIQKGQTKKKVVQCATYFCLFAICALTWASTFVGSWTASVPSTRIKFEILTARKMREELSYFTGTPSTYTGLHALLLQLPTTFTVWQLPACISPALCMP